MHPYGDQGLAGDVKALWAVDVNYIHHCVLHEEEASPSCQPFSGRRNTSRRKGAHPIVIDIRFFHHMLLNEYAQDTPSALRETIGRRISKY